MSQKDRILAHLRAGRVLNPLEALQRFGTLRCAARVFELRCAGWDVQMRRLKTRTGKVVALYWLKPQ